MECISECFHRKENFVMSEAASIFSYVSVSANMFIAVLFLKEKLRIEDLFGKCQSYCQMLLLKILTKVSKS